MKKMKKVLSLILTVIMVLAMAAPAYAEGETGTITIENATKDKEYTLYKIFKATLADPDAEGNDRSVNYIATAEQKEWFEGTEITDDESNKYSNPFTFTLNADKEYYVTVSAEKRDEVIPYLQAAKDELIDSGKFSQAGTQTPGSDGVIQFTGLDFGYYLVTSTLGSFISVDSTTPNVEIIDKNQGPNWEGDGKTITNADDSLNPTQTTANIGDRINYKLEINTTNYDGEDAIKTYTITDTLSDGMSYMTKENMEGDNTEDNYLTVKVGATTLVKDKDYNYTTGLSYDSTTFTINIAWKDEDNFKYSAPNKITIEYSAKLDEDAVIAGVGNENTASFTVTHDDDTENDDFEEKETVTYTFALGINKTDEEGTALAGAQFSVTDLAGNAVNVKAVEGEDGVYVYDSTSESNVVTSPEYGVIVIKGIEAGTYKLTEIKAPDGYNLVSDISPINASISEIASYKETYQFDYIDGVPVESETGKVIVKTYNIPVELVNVINVAGATLPSTGGMGTTIFYAAGIVLMAGAVFFVVRRKRA